MGIGGWGGVKGKKKITGMERMDQLWIQIPWMSSVLQNKIVDQCERLQLQSATITKYVADVLPGKNQRAVVGNFPPSPSPLARLLG